MNILFAGSPHSAAKVLDSLSNESNINNISKDINYLYFNNLTNVSKTTKGLAFPICILSYTVGPHT